MTDLATLVSARVDLPAGALEDLRAEVRGAVLEPADPGQQEVRAVFNAMHPSNPGADRALLPRPASGQRWLGVSVASAGAIASYTTPVATA